MRVEKFLDHCKTIATGSDFKFRHGAILVNCNNIIRSSCNSPRPIIAFNKFHPNRIASLHAEIGCILNMKLEQTRGCDIYVCRILRNNKFANSYPCEMCQAVCSKMGIRKIYYSIADNDYGVLKL